MAKVTCSHCGREFLSRVVPIDHYPDCPGPDAEDGDA